MAHKASGLSDQHFLSCATALATSQNPALFHSFSTVLLKVVFGLPLTLQRPGVHSNALKQSFSPSPLSMCPSQFHLVRRTSQLMSLISANSTTLLFFILCCHLIRSIRLKHCHWKLFSFRSSSLVIFQVSQSYSSTGRIGVSWFSFLFQ